MRRVVTGHRDGRSTCVSDDRVEPIWLSAGTGIARVWGADEAPTFPDDGGTPSYHWFIPPVGGYRYVQATMLPGVGTPDEDVADMSSPDAVAAAMKAAEQLGTSATTVHVGDRPGMHATDSIDIVVVLSGRLSMELEDGTEVHLDPGDTVIQNGTQHAWRNYGPEPVRYAVFLAGAHRA